ncbi:ABC transporter ATP-binding protein [Variovorax sp. VRV01]|uniref:ABC transporter ATP-binding protein n=1 Tax=Variovorax sp. VRV01 TaxID=2769259 RepID=UPI0017807014|nr:ABC transporter ATP-binding protein [Variovorax sp. VRV01]MBD9665464.1 ABC transporter ATP-binding protein [Variovorax sp. VRV01]
MTSLFPGAEPAGTPASASAPSLLEISNLTVDFDGVRTIHGLDLRVAPGEMLGIVGESGSGKSVTWLAALGLLPARAAVGGEVRLGGEQLLGAPVATLERVRGKHIAMIFQDPASSLNPVMRVGKQLGEALALHRGLHGAAARAEAKRLFDLVGLPDAAARLNSYPHELSGGQNQRVMIAMALAGEPELLVADEPTTALDVTVQAQILDLLADIREETGMAVVLISHDLSVIAETCARVIVMYCGRIVEDTPSELLFEAPLHPYTRGLLAALPPLAGPRRRLATIEGQVPNPASMPQGCAFAPRCPERQAMCNSATPALVRVARGRQAACVGVQAPQAKTLHWHRRAQA